jgi:RNA polymerase sigma-70 factor (ECF subfamily)
MTAAADVPVRPMSAGVAEAARPDVRPVAGDPVDEPALDGEGRGAGSNNRRNGAVRDGSRSRELPETLVVGAARGDERARDELLALIQPLVLGYCRARLGRRESVHGSAEDVAQDVCMAVVGALRSYQPKGLSFRAFVFGIASNKVADVFRAAGRDRTEPVAELPDSLVASDGPEDRLLAAERSERLRALLDCLTPRQREILVLRVPVGMSAQEAAQTVGSTPQAIRVTQHRALARLRRTIKEGEAAAEVAPQ